MPAGFDRFASAVIEAYLGRYAQEQLGIEPRRLLALGREHADDPDEPFNMAYLAIRGSAAVNGVSRLHGAVSRRIFQSLFPRWPEIEVPVGHVTNGVHTPSWDSAEADELWTTTCGAERWRGTMETVEQDVARASDEDLWALRVDARKALVAYVRERIVPHVAAWGAAPDEAAALGACLDGRSVTTRCGSSLAIPSLRSPSRRRRFCGSGKTARGHDQRGLPSSTSSSLRCSTWPLRSVCRSWHWSLALPLSARRHDHAVPGFFLEPGRCSGGDRLMPGPARTRDFRPSWASLEGVPFPLGATWIAGEDAWNFAVYSEHAERVTLLLYGEEDPASPILARRLDYLQNKSGPVWHCRLRTTEMKGARFYAYQMDGPRAPYPGFDRGKILFDPYARALHFPPGFDRNAAMGPGANAGRAPLGLIAADRESFDWGDDRPRRHEADAVIYELHVRGFTAHPSSGVVEERRGTFAGLIDKIPYLLELGVTVVELIESRTSARPSSPSSDGGIGAIRRAHDLKQKKWLRVLGTFRGSSNTKPKNIN